MDQAHRQLIIFRQNHATRELPKKLASKIAYLRGYAKALKALQKGENEHGDSLDLIIKDVKSQFNRTYKK